MTAIDSASPPARSARGDLPAATPLVLGSRDTAGPDGLDIGCERDAMAGDDSTGRLDASDSSVATLVGRREHGPLALTPVETPRPLFGSAVSNPRARAGDGVGQLADAAPDTMTLHTEDAFRIFTGRQGDSEASAPAIPGARRFAAVLKSMWHLSANDNPYADWILIRMYDGLIAIRTRLNEVVLAREGEIERLGRKGLTLAIMGSRSPRTVELGFRSPYGYATAEVIVEFDYYVRVVKTLVQKDRISDAEGRAAVREIGRALRALFLEPIRWERHLLRDELRPLSRSDFLPGAAEAARQRVRAAVALFGEVPRKVFTGAEAPRHSQRRVMLTEPELRLLEAASLTAADDPAPATSDLL